MRRHVNVDLSTINKKHGHYDWKGSIGNTFKFEFDGQTGDILIKGVRVHDDQKNVSILLSYDGIEKEFSSQKIRNGNIITLVNRLYHVQEYNIGDVIKTDDGKELVVIGFSLQQKKNPDIWGARRMYYNLMCKQCKATFKLSATRLRNRQSICKCCSKGHRECFTGINDITQTDPWMVQYFPGGAQEACQYTSHSGAMINPFCPDCGKIRKKKISIGNINQGHGFQCDCSDSLPYPEKFVSALFNQFGLDYIMQAMPRDFCNNMIDRKYDFYFPQFSLIVETHGLQHYEECGNIMKSLKEQQENDKLKYEIAINGGILNYIVLDCRESQADWIKKSILNSGLDKLLGVNYSDVNWDKCATYAISNIAKSVCADFNNQHLFIDELSNKYHVHAATIRSYLKIGMDNGWCSYTRANLGRPLLVAGKGFYFYSYSDKHAHSFLLNKFGIKIPVKIMTDYNGMYGDIKITEVTDRELRHWITYSYDESNAVFYN